MIITTTGINESDHGGGVSARELAADIRRFIDSVGPNAGSSRVVLAACDDDYNAAGGIFVECNFTGAELATMLDAVDGLVVIDVCGARSGTEIEVSDCFDIVQLAFWDDLRRSPTFVLEASP